MAAVIAKKKELQDRGRYLYGINGLHPDALKVLFFASDATGCSWYRGRQTAYKINANFTDKINQIVSRAILAADETPEQGGILWDIILHQRQHDPDDLNWAKRMSVKRGVINVYESDDDFWNIDVNSSVHDAYDSVMLKKMQNYVSAMDYVTVSTEPLKRLYEKMCPRVQVIPNAIEFDIVDKIADVPAANGRIIIGWSGTTTHISDLKLIMPVIADILNKYKNVMFEIGGWPNCPLLGSLPAAQVLKSGWTNNMAEYYKSLKGRHIALAPLVDSKFNESKSNIKYLESAACGIPVIASEVAPYLNTIKHGVNGYLVQSTGSVHKQWKKALETLIDDAGLRRAMGEAGRQNVRENFNQDIISKKWVDFYLSIVKEKGLKREVAV